MKKKMKIEEKEDNYLAIGMCIGVCFGVTLGSLTAILTDNYILWMLFIALGPLIGLIIGSMIKKK